MSYKHCLQEGRKLIESVRDNQISFLVVMPVAFFTPITQTKATNDIFYQAFSDLGVDISHGYVRVVLIQAIWLARPNLNKPVFCFFITISCGSEYLYEVGIYGARV